MAFPLRISPASTANVRAILTSEEFKDEVRGQEALWTSRGVHAAPTIIFNGRRVIQGVSRLRCSRRRPATSQADRRNRRPDAYGCRAENLNRLSQTASRRASASCGVRAA